MSKPVARPGVRALVVAMSVGGLAGCGQAVKPEVKAEPLLPVAQAAAAGKGPVVEDRRPKADTTREFHSLLVTKCDYGVSTLPELPGRAGPASLANDMAAVPGDPWHGRHVEVEHYATYLNQKRQLKGNQKKAMPGLIPALILQVNDDCPESKMHGGYYTAAEVINAVPPLVVEIVVKIDGKLYRERSVYSPSHEVDVKLRNPTDAAQVAQAMTKADRALLALIGEPAPVAPPVDASAPAASPTDDEGFINM